jgi:hypothetical protein
VADPPTCPYCEAEHLWGLIHKPATAREIRHGCRVPNPGDRIRCAACRKVFAFDRDPAGAIVLTSAPQPKWYELWI